MDSLEPYILQNYAYDRLPGSAKQVLGASEKEWQRQVIEYSLSHQLRWRKNIGTGMHTRRHC